MYIFCTKKVKERMIFQKETKDVDIVDVNIVL